ncbi:MAG: hypothetical protein FJZ04_01445 [Candidatus Moranbacteria bacterium]|nr:hypothetical protein [Candidatus Moranbacteria bacterium]
MVDISGISVRLNPEVFRRMLAGIPVQECPILGCNSIKSPTYPVCQNCHTHTDGEASTAVNLKMVDLGGQPLREPFRGKPPDPDNVVTAEERIFSFVYGSIKYHQFTPDSEELIEYVFEFNYRVVPKDSIKTIIGEAEEKLKKTGWVPLPVWQHAFDAFKKLFEGDNPPNDSQLRQTSRLWLPPTVCPHPELTMEKLIRAVRNNLGLQ